MGKNFNIKLFDPTISLKNSDTTIWLKIVLYHKSTNWPTLVDTIAYAVLPQPAASQI